MAINDLTNIRIAGTLIISLFMSMLSSAQSGCTDPLALNFDEFAVDNDGSCEYPVTTQGLPLVYGLSEANPNLNENSGLETDQNGDIWILNDGGFPPVFMGLQEATGWLQQTVNVTNATNVDWEDMAQSPTHLFIADVGNNSSGDRDNLVIYKVALSDLPSDAILDVEAESIYFSYPEQGLPQTSPVDSTHWDCEAIIWLDDYIHLFTKDWITYETRHYRIPDAPGTYDAELVESFDAGGLITAADINEDGTIVLLGYTLIGQNFMWVLWDYSGDELFSGNKRRIEFGLAIEHGQTEGIIFSDLLSGYVSSERFVLGQFINVAPRLMSFSIEDYFTGIQEPQEVSMKLWPNPVNDVLSFDYPLMLRYIIIDSEGKICDEGLSSGQISVGELSAGSYLIQFPEVGAVGRFSKY